MGLRHPVWTTADFKWRAAALKPPRGKWQMACHLQSAANGKWRMACRRAPLEISKWQIAMADGKSHAVCNQSRLIRTNALLCDHFLPFELPVPHILFFRGGEQ